MTMTATDVTSIEPIDHDEAMALQEAELARVLDLLGRLGPEDWVTQTECPDWDVRQMFIHVLGACEAGASMRENLHQLRAGRRRAKADGAPLEAGLSAVQVAERADLSPDELQRRLADVAPRTVQGRRRLPRLVRAARMKIDGPVVETWRLGYLVDVIYLRDLWMHRVDACQVTGADLVLSGEHDGRIVADVVAEWARRHGQPFELELGGPAGGSFTAGGGGGERLEMDAVEFCRRLAGRGERSGLLETIVPF